MEIFMFFEYQKATIEWNLCDVNEIVVVFLWVLLYNTDWVGII